MADDPLVEGAAPAAPEPRSRALPWLAAALIALAALAPSLGTLSSGVVSDDAFALGYVHREGPLADWLGTQYDLSLVRFWRPLVTTTLDLQEQLWGAQAAPYRLFNLAGQAAAALLLAALARRLGAGRWPALAAGLLAAWFPYQGGTATWLVGRVDSLAVPLFLAAVLLALDRRPLFAALLAFAACASKELAFVAPVWVALLAWGRGETPREALGRSLSVAAACALAFAWRWLAIGTPVGGYLAGSPTAAPWKLLQAWALAGGTLLAAALLAPLVAATCRGARPRPWSAALAAALVAALPLQHLMAGGRVEVYHLRTFFLSDLALVLAFACAARGPDLKRTAGLVLVGLALALGATRVARAWQDTHQWAAAGREADALAAGVRAELSRRTEPGPLVLGAFPEVHGRAYLFHWGVADRFRAPFEPAAREVWPLRPLFLDTRLPMASPGPAGLLIGEGLGGAGLAPQSIRLEGSEELAALLLDHRILSPDPQGPPPPELIAILEEPWERLQVVVYTELGYLGCELSAAPPEPRPGGGWQSRLGLLELLQAGDDRYRLYQGIVQAADTGARQAWLELRIPGAPGELPLAVSDAIELRWQVDLAERVHPKWIFPSRDRP